MIGIITLPLVPLRVMDNEICEMCTQLLFGERVEILKTTDKWLYIINLNDGCVGWLEVNQVHVLTEEENKLFNTYFVCLDTPIIHCIKSIPNESMYLPGGSYFPSYNYGRCMIGEQIYQINSLPTAFLKESVTQKIANCAMQYLNTPYLSGGKSIMGIDNSGLVQVVFAMAGVQLTRNVSQQVEAGVVIDFFFEAQQGDLAFFEDFEHRIVHVGILLNKNQIIHSYGSVRIDTIDSEGIISAKNGEYTHKLRIIKRVI